MKRFTEYLLENTEETKYCFKIKIAGDIPDDCEKSIEHLLQKYKVSKFKKCKTTPIQAKLRDFPTMENAEVHIFDLELEYPTTSTVLANCIAHCTGITINRIKVRSDKEEQEVEINTEHEINPQTLKAALLNTPYPKENNQDLVGDKGVSNFLKDLAKARKDTGPNQYTGVNDAILAKKSPSEKAQTAVKEKVGKSLFGSTNRSIKGKK